MRNRFDEVLNILNKKIVEMSECAEKIILFSAEAFVNQNMQKAKNAIEHDVKIDDLEREIEKICMKLLIRHQPVARDLRTVSSALKIITDIEHIGDQASKISKLVLRTIGSPDVQYIDLFLKASRMVGFMVTHSVNAFVKNDLDLAIKIIRNDDLVDKIFSEIKSKIIDNLRKNKIKCEKSIDVLMIAKYFERIGDHAAHIANWAIFSITGMHKIEFEKVDVG
ncbi:MAG: phosphate signaling complex protein PhoU [Clostridiales bacterium]|jgi:phosphate transport system protein|nr:phosphate signaling complex protein PhoU [Clostridiales bacterium]